MLQLKMSGRTGNQLFQYAMIRSYMIKNDIKDLYISEEHIEKFKRMQNDNSFKNYLHDFNTIDFTVIKKVNENIFQKLIQLLYKIDYKINLMYLKFNKKKFNMEFWRKNKNRWKKIMNKCGIYYCFKDDYTFFESNSKDKIFFGSFESEKYFKEIREILLKEFTPKQDKLEKNKQLYDAIENTNSVCVTIRRGDFLLEKNIKNFYICTPEYFEKAINEIKAKIDNPQFIIFSDDIQWCKENIKFPDGTLFETGEDPIWEKLRLMYTCKHFILSNSTFSWWAQYLSRNDNKVVIAPSIWSKTNYCDDIYQENWIKIDV